MIKTILVFLFSSFIFANSKLQFDKFLEKKMYFSAYTTLFELDIAQFQKKDIETALSYIDPAVFLADTRLVHYSNVPGFEYAMAVIELSQGGYNKTIQLAQTIKNQRLTPFARFLIAESYYKQGNASKANYYYSECAKDATLGISRFKYDSYMYENLLGICLQSIGRVFYETKDYAKAIKYFKKIDQKNYMWPSSLIDRAWSYYHLKDYTRALGTLLSFKLDILKKFYGPEVQYLRSLIYYELCYYARSEGIISNFENGMWSSYNDLVTLIRQSARLPYSELEKKLSDKKYEYINLYIQQLKRSHKYRKHWIYSRSIVRELKLLSQHKDKAFFRDIYNFLQDYQKVIAYTRDNALREKIYEYVKEVRVNQKRLAKLKLNINLKKRQLVRAKNELQFDKEVISKSISSIKDSKNKYVWEFKGGFWIDEMGDYAVAVENKCE